MGGVDRLYQNVDKYRTTILSKKCWWPIFAFCLDVSTQQVWHVFRLTQGNVGKTNGLLAVCHTITRACLARGPRHSTPGRPHKHSWNIFQASRTFCLQYKYFVTFFFFFFFFFAGIAKLWVKFCVLKRIRIISWLFLFFFFFFFFFLHFITNICHRQKCPVHYIVPDDLVWPVKPSWEINALKITYLLQLLSCSSMEHEQKPLPSRSHDPIYGIDLLTTKNALFL